MWAWHGMASLAICNIIAAWPMKTMAWQQQYGGKYVSNMWLMYMYGSMAKMAWQQLTKQYGDEEEELQQQYVLWPSMAY